MSLISVPPLFNHCLWIDSGTNTQTITTAGVLATEPVPKGKKARIKALEKRVAELEARLARMPEVSYTYDPFWQIPPVTCKG